MHDPATILATSFTKGCEDLGVRPPPDLRLLAAGAAATRLARAGGPSTSNLKRRGSEDGDGSGDASDPYALGVLRERLLLEDERRGQGAWYTPQALARDLVARTVTTPGVVADPAMGGGVFLLAAAERLHGFGLAPSEIVGSLLWGADIDALAVAVAEASLWMWSARFGEPTVAGDHLVVGDALADVRIPAAAAVVGNPPFLGQLRRATTVDDARRAALKARFDGCVAPYTDMAWLFLLAAIEAVEPGGRVTLIQPQSVLAARDATQVRDRIDQLARLEECWVDDGDTFAANVEVCAPTLHRRLDPGGAADAASGQASAGSAAIDARGGPVSVDPGRPASDAWAGPLLDHLGVPRVCLATEPDAVVLGDRANVVAGFRDEYYGLVDAVRDGGSGPALVTSGSIDPLRRRNVTISFARTKWVDPRIDVTAINGRARRWVETQMQPGLLVASQTKIIEALVDETGDLVVGVPGIAVLPHDLTDVWSLAAALHAPCVSAWMMARTAGTGMSAAVCRPTARLVGDVPLPSQPGPWADAAGLAERLSHGEECWTEFATAADASYGIDDTELRDWWLSRLPDRRAESDLT